MSVASEQTFHTGDRAWYPFGGGEVQVEVIEELGPIGLGGRHLVRVRRKRDYADPLEVTIAEADLRPVTGAA